MATWYHRCVKCGHLWDSETPTPERCTRCGNPWPGFISANKRELLKEPRD
jgi:predicted  nucleic acid-binding Zn-ribbon protein